MVSNEKIKEVLNKLDIVDVVQSYIPLTKKGNNFVGMCPFHEDTHPSLSVSQKKQIFKCFSCGTSGNAISFLQKYKNITFLEALRDAAAIANIELNESTSPNRQYIIPKETQRVFDLNKEFMEYSNYLIRTEEGKIGASYLYDRDYTKAMIDYSKIGYLGNTAQLVKYLVAKNFTLEDMIKNDIVNLSNDGELYSKWEHRVIFPISDKDGNVHGFTARKIDTNPSTAKYINTAETNVFQKSKLFYNLQNASDDIKAKKEVILMEGSSDVDQSCKLSYTNTIATLGTALSKEHVQYLKNLNVRVRLCYDGDLPGYKASLKAHELLTIAGVETIFTSLPENQDPDSLCRNAPETFSILIKENNNYLDYILKHVPDISDFNEKEKFTLSFLKSLSTVHNPLKQEYYISELSRITSFSNTSLNKSFNELYKPILPYEAKKVTRMARTEIKETNAGIKINFKEKEKMIYKDEVSRNFDKLNGENAVIAFDDKKILTRTDILSKYIYQKGRVLETLITVINKENIDYAAQNIVKSACAAIAQENNILKENIQYVAFLHKDTKCPHIHLQVWQEEPYLNRYKLTEHLIKQMKETTQVALEKNQTLESPTQEADKTEIVVNTILKI